MADKVLCFYFLFHTYEVCFFQTLTCKITGAISVANSWKNNSVRSSEKFGRREKNSAGLYAVVGKVTVPDNKSRNIPEVVLVRHGQLGFWEFGGKGWGG